MLMTWLYFSDLFPVTSTIRGNFLAPTSLLPVMYALGGFKGLVILSLHQGGLLPLLVAPFAKALALPFAKALECFLFLLFFLKPKACSRPASKAGDMDKTLDPIFLLKSLLLVAIPFAKVDLLSKSPFGKVGLLSSSPFGKVLFSGVFKSLGYPSESKDTSLISFFKLLTGSAGSSTFWQGVFSLIFSTTFWSCRNSAAVNLLAHFRISAWFINLLKWFMTHVSLSCRKLHHIAPWNFELFTDGSSMTIFIRAWRRGCVWISQVGSTFSKECIKGNTCISPAASMPWLVDTVSYLPKFCTNSLCWLKVWYRTPESIKGLGRWRAPPLPVAIPFVKAVLSFWQGYSFWQGCSFWQGPSFWQGCSFWQGPSFWQGCSNPFVKDAEARYCFSKLEQKATIHKQL